ncbi:MAG: hypothetical protein U0641_05815 [Anaerolineae bacterium]
MGIDPKLSQMLNGINDGLAVMEKTEQEVRQCAIEGRRDKQLIDGHAHFVFSLHTTMEHFLDLITYLTADVGDQEAPCRA